MQNKYNLQIIIHQFILDMRKWTYKEKSDYVTKKMTVSQTKISIVVFTLINLTIQLG